MTYTPAFEVPKHLPDEFGKNKSQVAWKPRQYEAPPALEQK